MDLATSKQIENNAKSEQIENKQAESKQVGSEQPIPIPQKTLDFLTTNKCNKCEKNHCTVIDGDNIFIKFCGVDYVIKYDEHVQKFLDNSHICDCCQLNSQDDKIILSRITNTTVAPDYTNVRIASNISTSISWQDMYNPIQYTYNIPYIINNITHSIILNIVESNVVGNPVSNLIDNPTNILIDNPIDNPINITTNNLNNAPLSTIQNLITKDNIDTVFACINTMLDFDRLTIIVKSILGIKVEEFLSLEFFRKLENELKFSTSQLVAIINIIIGKRVDNPNKIDLNSSWNIINLAGSDAICKSININNKYYIVIKKIIKNDVNDKDLSRTLYEYRDLISKFKSTKVITQIITDMIKLLLENPNIKLLHDYVVMFAELLPQNDEHDTEQDTEQDTK